MGSVPNNDTHFPFGHAWSCGDTWDRPTSTDPAEVGCTVCRTEMACFPTGERPVYVPDPRGEMLAQRVTTSIENGNWQAMLTAAQELYAHRVGATEGAGRRANAAPHGEDIPSGHRTSVLPCAPEGFGWRCICGAGRCGDGNGAYTETDAHAAAAAHLVAVVKMRAADAQAGGR